MAGKKAKAAPPTFAFEARVVWTPAARKRVPPRRGTGAKPLSIDGASAWKRIREVFATIEGQIAAGLEKGGQKVGNIELDVPGTARAFERLKSKTPPSPSHDLDAEACMHAVLVYTCWSAYEKQVHASIVRHWIATGGPSFALEALAHAGTRHWYQESKRLLARKLDAEALVINGANVDEESWEILRAFLAGTDEETFSKALATAAKLFPEAQVGVQCGLAFALPDEAGFAETAFESCLAEAERDEHRFPVCGKLLLATRRDAKFIARVAGALSGMYGDSPFAVLDSLGVDAFPLLKTTFEELGKAMGPAAAQKKAMSWLSAIESLEAASYFVELLPHRHLRQAISDWFERAPHLAVVALASQSTSKQGADDGAAKDFLRLLVTRHPEAAGAACTKLGTREAALVAALRS